MPEKLHALVDLSPRREPDCQVENQHQTACKSDDDDDDDAVLPPSCSATVSQDVSQDFLRAMAQTVVCKVDRPPGPLTLGLQKSGGFSSRRRIIHRVFLAADSTA